MERKKVIILGAAGRDFHNFNMFFRDNEEYEVVAFTAAQIPNIEGRRYPPSLAGRLYPHGIPIVKEERLEELIEKYKVDFVVFAYSDVSNEHVMELAARSLSKGASYLLLGPKATMLKSKKPVIAVCAVRTGCGKSPLTRKIAEILKDMGKKPVIIRHPMPYGDLEREVVQRFATLKDLDKAGCTFEEREEYEEHIKRGFVVYAGVDYEKILREGEKEGDVVLWDGGNNDFPFIQPDILFVVADALRPGHEIHYYPGNVNFRMADVIVISKSRENPEGKKIIEKHAKAINPKAQLIEMDLEITLEGEVEGKRVIVVEDGPTITHGGMKYGAGYIAAKRKGATIVDPKPFAIGSLAETFKKYPHIGPVLPALGYGERQKKELEEVINRIDGDCVVLGTPIDLCKVLKINKPCYRAKYEAKIDEGKIRKILEEVLESKVRNEK